MGRAKNGTIKNFNNLSNDNKARELKKLAKRANVRLAYMEEKGITNSTYKYASNYNKEVGRKSNRFFEGTRYKSSKELNQAYKTLTAFLNDDRSLMRGVKYDIIDRVKEKVKDRSLDYHKLKKLPKAEREYAMQYLSKLSNRRLKSLEDAKKTKGAYDKAYVHNVLQDGKKKNRFYTGYNKGKLKGQFQNVVDFLNSKTSTIRGWNAINRDRINTFRDKGVFIPQGKEQEFIDFLSSNQFAQLKERADSNQIIEMYHNARKRDIEVDKMNKEFDSFLNNPEKNFDELLEDLEIAPWEIDDYELLH